MFMYFLIFMVCAGVGVYISKKIDENWENGLYDHLYYDEDEYDEEDDYEESESESEEVTSEYEDNTDSELKDLDDVDRTK